MRSSRVREGGRGEGGHRGGINRRRTVRVVERKERKRGSFLNLNLQLIKYLYKYYW